MFRFWRCGGVLIYCLCAPRVGSDCTHILNNVLELASASHTWHNSKVDIQEQVILAPHTTFSIGGPARFFIRAHSRQDVDAALDFAKENQIPVFILGGGSNVLISDKGFAGLVIRIDMRGVSIKDDGTYFAVTAQAGESWDGLVDMAVGQELWGIENLSGIPGTVGGAVVQNIGAYGSALSQTLISAEVFDTRSNTALTLSRDACAFGYRESIFKKEQGRYVVLSATFGLSNTAVPDVSYKDLAQRFEGRSPSLVEIRNAVLEIRRNKFPDLALEGTAGSFFKNPVLQEEDAITLAAQYPGLPLFSLPESSGKKVALAWLLDIRNGVLDVASLCIGGARLFEKQPLVIVAKRNTSSTDIVSLAEVVREKIKNKFGIEIEFEVHVLA